MNPSQCNVAEQTSFNAWTSNDGQLFETIER